MGSAALCLVLLAVLAFSSVTEEALFGLAPNIQGIPYLSGGIKWDNLHLKYDPPFIGRYGIPLSTNKIGKEYQFLEAHKELPKVSLWTYGKDPRVQLMYDDKGNICGLRVAYIKAHLKNKVPEGESFPYSFDDKKIFKTGSAFGHDYYYIDVLFIHPDILKNGGPAERKEAVGTGVYIQMDGKTWTEMPRNEKETDKTDFTKQACFVGMGQHYFYRMTPEMKCEDHNPVFLLYHSGELIGLGLIPFGTHNDKVDGFRSWFENPPKWVINTIVPRAPKCLADWVGKYGTTSLHIYFRKFNALNCIL